ncbi:MAG TPA: hypothetical protein VJZ48_04105 [Bacilli bacterium]|nr:hypothetical protein [Bacilli bacterium]
MTFKSRLFIFFNTYMWFAILLFFTGSLWTLILPVLGLLTLAFGGFIHVRHLD